MDPGYCWNPIRQLCNINFGNLQYCGIHIDYIMEFQPGECASFSLPPPTDLCPAVFHINNIQTIDLFNTKEEENICSIHKTTSWDLSMPVSVTTSLIELPIPVETAIFKRHYNKQWYTALLSSFWEADEHLSGATPQPIFESLASTK